MMVFDLPWDVIDIIFQRLDFPINPTLKRRYVTLLVKLSEASALYPQCLVLKDVEKPGFPAVQGGFGEVYRGRFRGRGVAIKVLRIYENSNMDALKVIQH
jgi:hypothetical protein